MTRVHEFLGGLVRTTRVTFASLAIPNYRRYASGQSVSMIGTWMQTTAQAWLVLTLTHSAVFLGLVVVLPVLGHATWHLYRRVVPRRPGEYHRALPAFDDIH